MILVDVNVLVYAFRSDAPEHPRYRQWIVDRLAAPSAFGIVDQVLAGFLRIVTHPAIFIPPSDPELALEFCATIKAAPHCVLVTPGPRHWEIFVELCRRSNARGNLIPDAWLAALAIESGSEWITADLGFARFAGLRWRHPFETTH